MEKPKVALVMPHYGPVDLGAARGLYAEATKGKVDLAFVADSCSSATPHCFNGLLALALDARDRGDVTHFAMLHSDIAPRVPGWVDVLWECMQATQADLISAIVPIKEPERARTSTAIGKRDNPWYPDRYINVQDRATLPETFGPERVCEADEVLLVNTGCFLADLRRAWWDGFAFNFDCRITTRDGKRIAQFNPEDWQMSRHIQAAGGRVVATWRVPVVHHGSGEWPNQ